MTSLHAVSPRVHSDDSTSLEEARWLAETAAAAMDEIFIPSPADEAWLSADSRAEPEAPIEILSDYAWIRDQKLSHHLRSEAEPEQDLVVWILESLLVSMPFQGTHVATVYAKRRAIKLDQVRLPLPTTRRSKLARALDVEASWYLHLDTDAGRLVAHQILFQADLVNELGSDTLRDWEIDEAAWHAAALDAMFA